MVLALFFTSLNIGKLKTSHFESKTYRVLFIITSFTFIIIIIVQFEILVVCDNKHQLQLFLCIRNDIILMGAEHPNVISVFLNRGHELQTTISWEFLGLENNGVVPKGSIWEKARYGEGTIIANFDTGQFQILTKVNFLLDFQKRRLLLVFSPKKLFFLLRKIFFFSQCFNEFSIHEINNRV